MRKIVLWLVVFGLFLGLNISRGMASKQLTKWSKSLSTNSMTFIPEGKFDLGSDSGEVDEMPIHTVHVKPFYIDRYEVTNREFKEFIRANPQWSKENIAPKYHDGDYLRHWSKGTYPIGLANHPVVYVSWYAAKAYAEWRNKRLPTEVEWEKAASYNLVNNKMPKGHKYKWSFGDVFNAQAANTAHYNGLPVGGLWGMWWNDFSSGLMRKVFTGETTTPVGKFAPGVNELYDTTGNVWEWCLNWYRGDSYKVEARRQKEKEEKIRLGEVEGFDYLHEPTYGDKGSPTMVYRVLRGGSWSDNAKITRSTNRFKFKPNFTDNDVGFRCVADYASDKTQSTF